MMHTKIPQQFIETNKVSIGSSAPPRRLFMLKRFAERHSNFTTLSALTNQVFKAKSRHSSKGEIAGNGMLEFGVIVRIGRKIVIDEDAYFSWLDALQKSMGTMMPNHSHGTTGSGSDGIKPKATLTGAIGRDHGE